MPRRLDEFVQDPEIIEALHCHRKRLIVVMGNSDTGKTSLVTCLADLLGRKTEVGLVDLDMGQSHIGPPTTVAWGRVEGGFRGWGAIAVEDFYFIGSLTPRGNLVTTVVGAKLITQRALSACKKVVVDTTGFIAGVSGTVLKQAKIDLLEPDIILALERSDELGHIVEAFSYQKAPSVYRVSVPLRVEPKGYTERNQHRLKRFRSYFNGAKTLDVSFKAVSIRSTGEPVNAGTDDVTERIVSFRDDRNRDLALGLVEGVDSMEEKVLIRSPLKKDIKFSTVVFGSVKVAL
ncbi:MAG: Clp1/GlmU family protein [Syntrophobacteria bacterium]